MRFWNDKRVAGRKRERVQKCHCLFVLPDQPCRDLTGNYFAEYAVGVLRHRLLSGARRY
jgi:hypothetical protein